MEDVPQRDTRFAWVRMMKYRILPSSRYVKYGVVVGIVVGDVEISTFRDINYAFLNGIAVRQTVCLGVGRVKSKLPGKPCEWKPCITSASDN